MAPKNRYGFLLPVGFSVVATLPKQKTKENEKDFFEFKHMYGMNIFTQLSSGYDKNGEITDKQWTDLTCNDRS